MARGRGPVEALDRPAGVGGSQARHPRRAGAAPLKLLASPRLLRQLLPIRGPRGRAAPLKHGTLPCPVMPGPSIIRRLRGRGPASCQASRTAPSEIVFHPRPRGRGPVEAVREGATLTAPELPSASRGRGPVEARSQSMTRV